MKVLYLVPSGGSPEQISAFSFLDEEILGLADAGVEAHVLSTGVQRDQDRGAVHVLAVGRGTGSERLRTLRLLGRNFGRMPRGWIARFGSCVHSLRLEQRAIDAIRERGIELIHNHFGSIVGFGGMIARQETSTPLVVSFRGMDLLVDRTIDYGLRRDPLYDRTLRILLKNVDATMYATEFMREIGLRLGANPPTAVTVRKGVDLERFRPSDDRATLRAELGVSGPMILTVAGLIPRKGIDLILHALGTLSAQQPFTLVVCGDGPEAAALRELAGHLGIAERVHFVGRVSRAEVPRYFAACDLFVLASRLEAAGNVLLEAMASGRPVVCTDAGGPAEYVQDGSTGFVVPREDVPALADRIRRLLADAELRERFGREGRRVAEREYSYGRLVDQYLEVYRRVSGRSLAAVG